MFKPPDHYHNLSLRLSKVLDEIGVNETTVMKTRRIWKLNEHMFNTLFRLKLTKVSLHYFGSQPEVSTTQGLHSDTDILYCNHAGQVIQDKSQLHPCKLQYLMLQDETTSPGYCLLQVIIDQDESLLPPLVEHKHVITDSTGRPLLKNSYDGGSLVFGSFKHGPAECTVTPWIMLDHVIAFPCSSWPREAESWLHQQSTSGWPTLDLKRDSAKQGCFLVPVSSKTGRYEDLEWRISTSFAERNLMHSINITQLQCYILMKMFLKTFLQLKCDEAVSSFMCKNILFHCIAGSKSTSDWNECSLVAWLQQCLEILFACILTETCPHFMIPRNNLLAGKLTAEVKHQLVDIMRTLIENIEKSLLSIQIDDLGHRLNVKSGSIFGNYLESSNDTALNRAVLSICQAGFFFKGSIKGFQMRLNHHCPSENFQILEQIIFKLDQLQSDSSTEEQVVICLQKPFLCTIAGSILASEDIQHSRKISSEAFRWFSLGMESDVSSSKLKLASALYCSGDLELCEIILDALKVKVTQTTSGCPVDDFIEHVLHSSVYFTCSCKTDKEIIVHKYNESFKRKCFEKNEGAITQNTAFCVVYLPCEVNCIPVELKYEMFRSTTEDLTYRGRCDDWMDWAAVDSLPYLFFLQYKVYSQLRKPEEQQRAFLSLILITVFNTYMNFGHIETAWNLLGQCMEQENRYQGALACYIKSLKVTKRNNAANWHVSKMLARLIRRNIPENTEKVTTRL